MPSVSETKPSCRQGFSNRYPILKLKLLPAPQSVDVLTFGEGAVEVGRVADAAPGFEADEGTAGFKGRPDAEGFGLGAIHSQNRSAVLVEEIYNSHLSALEQ